MNIVKMLRISRYLKRKKKNKVCDNIIKFSDYYILDDIGREVRLELANGKTGVFEVVDLYYDNHKDVATNIKLDLIGYLDEKPIRECSFDEFVNMYGELKK